jgi:membrane-bound lytic murein transglycosylase D
VTINYPVDLRLVAECVDTSVNYLQELNPSLLRMTTPKDQSFTLNLPAGSREKYENAMTAIPPDMRTWWRYHHVEYGDTLASIAHKYHTSFSSIAEANSLTGDEVKVGSKLIIPVVPGRSNTETASYSRRATHYKVRKGDTLYSIADDFGVSVDKLRNWNHLRGTAVPTGRTLVIYKPVAAASSEEASSDSGSAPVKTSQKGKSASKSSPSPAAAKYHKVKKGETLSSIAESNHTSVAALKRDNPKLAADLRAGEVLIIRK